MFASYFWAIALPIIAMVIIRLVRRKPSELHSPFAFPAIFLCMFLVMGSSQIWETQIGLKGNTGFWIAMGIFIATWVVIGIIDGVMEEWQKDRYGPLP